MELTNDLLNIVWDQFTGKPKYAISPVKGFYLAEDKELIIVFKRSGPAIPHHTSNDAVILEDGELDALIEQIPELKSAIVLAGITGDDGGMPEEDRERAGIPAAKSWRHYWKARQRRERDQP